VGDVMKLSTVKVRLGVRRSLKRHAHRVYSRMASMSPDATARVNDLENFFNLIIAVVFLVLVIVALTLGLAMREAWMPQAAAAAFENESLRLLAPVAAGFVLTVIFYFTVLQALSRGIFETSGNLLLTWAKLANGGQQQKVLAEIEDWFRTRPSYAIDAFHNCYQSAPERVVDRQIVTALKTLKHLGGAAEAVLLRGALERRYGLLYLAAGLNSPRPGDPRHLRSYFRRARSIRNAIKVSLMYDLIGAELRDEVLPSESWRRHYVSSPRRQITSLFDSGDVSLRFRTAAPHYGWPSRTAPNSIAETAIVRAITCVENPARMPLILLAVKDVLKAFPEVIREFFPDCREGAPGAAQARARRLEEVLLGLQETGVHIYGKWKKETLQPLNAYDSSNQAVLRDLSVDREADEETETTRQLTHSTETDADWGLKWDPNRLNMSSLLDDGRTRMPFAVLIEAIERARESHGQEVVLKRGDLLIVDNLRCLIARYETDPADQPWWQNVMGVRQAWWLTGYYGFRKARG